MAPNTPSWNMAPQELYLASRPGARSSAPQQMRRPEIQRCRMPENSGQRDSQHSHWMRQPEPMRRPAENQGCWMPGNSRLRNSQKSQRMRQPKPMTTSASKISVVGHSFVRRLQEDLQKDSKEDLGQLSFHGRSGFMRTISSRPIAPVERIS